MYKEEVMEKARREVEIIKESIKEKRLKTSFAEGRISDNVEKDKYIRPILNYLGEELPFLRGIDPHPTAWDVYRDGKTYYLHTVIGTDVECAYTENEDGTDTLHTLTADERQFVTEDKVINKRKKSYAPFWD